MFGKEKALLGGGASQDDAIRAMDTAIKTLKQKSYESFAFFIVQLILFHLSSFLLMWLLYSWIVALATNVVLGFYLFFFVYNGLQLISELYIAEEDTIDSDMPDKAQG